jgi:hypothetical protein
MKNLVRDRIRYVISSTTTRPGASRQNALLETIASMGLSGALRVQLTDLETEHPELTEKLVGSEPRAVRLQPGHEAICRGSAQEPAVDVDRRSTACPRGMVALYADVQACYCLGQVWLSKD